jgi:hypothetical protein
MADERIVLSALWVALMLTYLLGDVLRIFAGDFTAGEMGGQVASSQMFLLAGVIMLVPIVMIVLSLVVPHPYVRWLTIIAAAGLLLFNAVGLPGYPGSYDRMLIAVGLVFNAVTIYYAWVWHATAA